MSDLFYDMLEGIVERIENESEDEKERLGAGITLRINKTKKAVNGVFDYTVKAREATPVEALRELRDMLDRHLAEITAFCEQYPIPDHANIEKF